MSKKMNEWSSCDHGDIFHFSVCLSMYAPKLKTETKKFSTENVSQDDR